jgi:hypothetical protein
MLAVEALDVDGGANDRMQIMTARKLNKVQKQL